MNFKRVFLKKDTQVSLSVKTLSPACFLERGKGDIHARWRGWKCPQQHFQAGQGPLTHRAAQKRPCLKTPEFNPQPPSKITHCHWDKKLKTHKLQEGFHTENRARFLFSNKNFTLKYVQKSQLFFLLIRASSCPSRGDPWSQRAHAPLSRHAAQPPPRQGLVSGHPQDRTRLRPQGEGVLRVPPVKEPHAVHGVQGHLHALLAAQFPATVDRRVLEQQPHTMMPHVRADTDGELGGEQIRSPDHIPSFPRRPLQGHARDHIYTGWATRQSPSAPQRRKH